MRDDALALDPSHRPERAGEGTSMTGRVVVVGVDGSAEAGAALRWAVEDAQAHGRSVAVVHVFSSHDLGLPLFAASERGVPKYEDYVPAMAEEAGVVQAKIRTKDLWSLAADELVRRAVSELGDPGGVEIVTETIPDKHPARALIDRSEGADLLVVGSRGLGGFEGLLLGSVSAACVRHAACPVVVVRAPADS